MARTPRHAVITTESELLHTAAKNIMNLRDEKDLTQAELARRSNISLTTLNELETGKLGDIRLSTLCAIAQALKVSTVSLFLGSDLELRSGDQARLLKASEDILRIARKFKA